MRRPSPQLPSLELFRQILRGQKPTDSTALKPTGRYFVSAATFKGLLLAFNDTSLRVSAVQTRRYPSSLKDASGGSSARPQSKARSRLNMKR
jgi:hypothetical protein